MTYARRSEAPLPRPSRPPRGAAPPAGASERASSRTETDPVFSEPGSSDPGDPDRASSDDLLLLEPSTDALKAVRTARQAARALKRLEDDEHLLRTVQAQIRERVRFDAVELWAIGTGGVLERVGGDEHIAVEGSAFERVIARREARIATPLPLPTRPGDERAAAAGLASALGLPLPASTEVVGVLALYARGPAAFGVEHADVLAPVAELLAQLVLERRIRDAEAALRRAQAQLVANDKLTALGQLAAGVAHEVNNPAACVITNLDHARTLVLGSAPALRAAGLGAIAEELGGIFKDSLEAMRRIAEVVGHLRHFSREADDGLEPVHLDDIVRTVVTMLAADVKARARIELELGGVPEIAGSRTRLTQVILNLVMNAVQACQERESAVNVVRVATRIERDEKAGAPLVVLSVSDTGAGIPNEVKRRVFEPFFTTKALGQGTGLGLAVSREIVRRLGGSIGFESREGLGTTFHVRLPMRVPPAEDRPSGSVQAQTGARPRVLIVDDEPTVCRALARMLSKQAEVVTLGSAEGAMELLGSGASFDLVISDLLLPGATGMDLHAFVARSRPELGRRTLFLTGGAVSERARAFVEENRAQVLSKPVEPARLRAIVEVVAAGNSVRRAVKATEA